VLLLDTSNATSKSALLDINDRLTRQIEDNLQLFDNLNQELAVKEAALISGEVKLSQKDKEVKTLKS
jgi:hypothetical protein